jgi:bifunctional oligoribonuclease and PAP phosphatase NrnA
MKFNTEELEKIRGVIEKSNRILIIPHKNPDGDAIGGALGLFQIFTNLKKEPEVVCFDSPPAVYSFLPNSGKVKVGLGNLNYDCVFILDSGATHLTGFRESHPRLFDKSMEVINIDHHPSNDFYGKYNLVITEAASATAILYELCAAINLPVDRNTATCFLTGIYTDTGSFMHSNTDSATLNIAARLLAKGADLRTISKDIFNTTAVSTMHLWGRVMRNIYKTDDGVAMSVITKKDFDDTGADYSEMTGAIDFVNSVPGARYSVVLTERDGKVKGSLRTLKEEVDVAKIAGEFGGGGHTKAAGFTLAGQLEKEVKWKVVE